jgi:hypothetical protein
LCVAVASILECYTWWLNARLCLHQTQYQYDCNYTALFSGRYFYSWAHSPANLCWQPTYGAPRDLLWCHAGSACLVVECSPLPCIKHPIVTNDCNYTVLFLRHMAVFLHRTHSSTPTVALLPIGCQDLFNCHAGSLYLVVECSPLPLHQSTWYNRLIIVAFSLAHGCIRRTVLPANPCLITYRAPKLLGAMLGAVYLKLVWMLASGTNVGYSYAILFSGCDRHCSLGTHSSANPRGMILPMGRRDSLVPCWVLCLIGWIAASALHQKRGTNMTAGVAFSSGTWLFLFTGPHSSANQHASLPIGQDLA